MEKRQQRGSLQEIAQLYIEQLQRLKGRTRKGLRLCCIAHATRELFREREKDTDESIRNLQAWTSELSKEDGENGTQILVIVRNGFEGLSQFISVASEALNARLTSLRPRYFGNKKFKEREYILSQALEDIRKRTGMLHSLLGIVRVEAVKQPEHRTKNQVVVKGTAQASMGSMHSDKPLCTAASTAMGHERPNHAFEFQEFQMATDELVRLILEDEQLKPLLDVAFMRADRSEDFTPRFRMLLRAYINDIKKELPHTCQKAAAGLFRAQVTYVANEIQRSYTIVFRGDGPSDVKNKMEGPVTDHDKEYDDDAPDSRMGSDTTVFYTASKHSNNLRNRQSFLNNVKPFLRTGEASRNLRNRLHRIVYPDTLEAINKVISKEHALSIDKRMAIFNVCWSVKDYVRSEFGQDTSLLRRDDTLHEILTMTGTASKAYATSAAGYVRWRWPHTKVDLLSLVASLPRGRFTEDPENRFASSQKGFSQSPGKEPLHVESADFSVRFEFDKLEDMLESGWTCFRVRGSLTEIVETAQQLAWLSATFRVPKYGQISYSEVVCEPKTDMVFNIRALELEEVREVDSACWPPLSVNGIVARGFPIPPQNEGKGIEFSFNGMTSPAKTMHPVSH